MTEVDLALHPDARGTLKKLGQKTKKGAPKLSRTDFVTPSMGYY